MRSDQRSDGRNRPHQSIQDPRRLTSFGSCCFCLPAAFLGVVMACKCIHHPEWGCADQSMKVSMCLQMLLASWLAGWQAGWLDCKMHPLAAGVMSGWWCIMRANLLHTHAKQCLSINTGPFLKPRVSKSTRIHWWTRK